MTIASSTSKLSWSKKRIALGAAATFLLMQLGMCAHENPPVTGEIDAPGDVKAVLRRACYDCHSNETKWLWYAYVAPVSWLVHRDVYDGRHHLNFSEWRSLPADKRKKKQRSAGEQVREGEMPLWFYLPLHPEAKLSDADKELLRAWADGPTSP
jgi:hypothetical protein